MKIITCLSHKGGVGKTTLAYNLSAGLACWGYRVCMVDADPQGSLTHLAGFTREPMFYDLIVRDAAFGSCLREIEQKVYRPQDPNGRLLLMPGNAETDNINLAQYARRLRDRLRALENDFDFIMIDTNPSPSKLHVGAYLATDYIIYPTVPEDMPLIGLQDSIQFTSGANELRADMGFQSIQVAGIIPNLVSKKTVQHQHFLKKMREKWGGFVWPEISRLTAWSESSAFHQPVFVYDRGGQASKQLWQIVDQLEEVLAHGRQAEAV